MKCTWTLRIAALWLLVSALPVVAASQEAGSDLQALGDKVVAEAFAQLGIEKAAPGEIACLTNAGYVRYQQRSTRPLYDVLSNAGISMGRGNLLPVHDRLDGELWFAFLRKEPDGRLMFTYLPIRPDGVKATAPIDVRVQKHQSFDPYREVLGERTFAVVTLANGWADGLPEDLLYWAAFHDHFCAGVTSGVSTVGLILKSFPLAAGEKYTFIGVPGTCQDDYIINALNLTPGKRTYLSMQYPWPRPWRTADAVHSQLGGIIVRFDSERNTGSAAVLRFQWHKEEFLEFLGEPDLEPDWKQMPWLHILYNRFFMEHRGNPEYFVRIAQTKELKSREDFDSLVKLGANPLAVLLGPDVDW